MGDISRRDVLRAGAFGALALSSPALLAACQSDTKTGGRHRYTPSSTSPTTVAFDTTKPWWLQGDFAPVAREVEAHNLSVTGAIPPELTGLYVRNGSNPVSGDSTHWFFGDGMVHGVQLERGKAVWYRNRYVHTALYDARQGFGGSGAPGGSASQSNVSVVSHAGKLLTSGEVGFPYQLRHADLSTVGVYDFAGKLATNFTAHPKIDPATGFLHFFGYGFTDPFLTYHVADAQGRLISSQVVKVSGPTMIHDFAITEHDVVFWELPVVFDLKAAIKWIKDPKSGELPYKWQPSYGARVGVMPLGGPTSAIRWSTLDPCYAFHGVNAYRDGDKVVLDICRLSSMFKKGEKFGGELSLRQWTIDPQRGTVDDTVLIEHQPGELPTRDPRRVGRRHRYGYFVETRDDPNTVDFGGVIKHDFTTGRRETWDPGPSVHSGEWLFVPAAGSSQEDAGWLLAYVYDASTLRSDLVIVDATAVGRGPVARIALPQRVPYGFHAAWVPA